MVDSNLHAIREETKGKISVIDFETDLLGFWLGLGKFIRKIFRFQFIPTYWRSAVIFSLFIVVISLLLHLIFNKNNYRQEDIILASIFYILMTPIIVIGLQNYFKNVFNIWRNHIIDLMIQIEDLKDYQHWLGEFLSMRKRSVNGFWFSLFLTMITIIVDFTITPEVLNIGAYFLMFVLYFISGIVAYLIFMFMKLSLRIRNYQFEIFKSEPINSGIVTYLSRLFGNFVVLFGALFAVVTFLATFIDERVVIFLLLTGWFPIAVIFGINQFTLRRIISRAKSQKLREIQMQIEALESQDEVLSKETLEHIEALMNYHDRVRGTRDSALNVRSILNFLNSLLLPLLAFFLSSIADILSLLSPP